MPGIRGRKKILGYFASWCRTADVTDSVALQRDTVAAWQQQLHRHRKRDGRALTVGVQHNRLIQLQAFFGWLTKNGHIDFNPASDLELPKLPARLPMTILSPQEIESVLSEPDLQTTTGLRDRALLELLWSTGIRRGGSRESQPEEYRLGPFRFERPTGERRKRPGAAAGPQGDPLAAPLHG